MDIVGYIPLHAPYSMPQIGEKVTVRKNGARFPAKILVAHLKPK